MSVVTDIIAMFLFAVIIGVGIKVGEFIFDKIYCKLQKLLDKQSE